MVMRRLLFSCALALAACGGAPAKPPIGSRAGGDDYTPPMTLPVNVLRALASAARADDGDALDALVHPEHGMWLWDQPGAAVSPTLHMNVGGGGTLTQRVAATGMNEYWKEHYWSVVAAGLDALDRTDTDPDDPHAPIYGDCGDEVPASDLRSWLLVKDDFWATYGPILVDTPFETAIAPALRQSMTHFRSWGLDVWMVEDGGRLWVAHVMVWTPCDA
jgi:hypothetical protein